MVATGGGDGAGARQLCGSREARSLLWQWGQRLRVVDASCRSEQVLAQLRASPTEVLVALGREGKKQAQIDAASFLLAAAIAAKVQCEDGQAKYRRRKAIVEPPNA